MKNKVNELKNDEIEKLIEEVLALDDDSEELRDIEMPSRETFDEWIRLGEAKYRKRQRIKWAIIGTAVALAIVALIFFL